MGTGETGIITERRREREANGVEWVDFGANGGGEMGCGECIAQLLKYTYVGVVITTANSVGTIVTFRRYFFWDFPNILLPSSDRRRYISSRLRCFFHSLATRVSFFATSCDVLTSRS